MELRAVPADGGRAEGLVCPGGIEREGSWPCQVPRAPFQSGGPNLGVGCEGDSWFSVADSFHVISPVSWGQCWPCRKMGFRFLQWWGA